MARSIKISDDGMEAVRNEVPISLRSLGAQVEYWMRIGRAIEKSERFSYTHVREALSGQISTDELTSEEQVVFLEEFTDLMWRSPSTKQEADFAKHLGNSEIVGLDDDNKLVYENQDKP